MQTADSTALAPMAGGAMMPASRVASDGEITPMASQAKEQHEIQSAIVVARQFPRDEDRIFGSVMKSCSRGSFASEATYSFPRGGKTIKGPSIYLARECARLWGNIRHGCDIVQDDDMQRTIRAWAWDVETNTKITQDDTFRKLIFRKKGPDGKPAWIEPDERDLRELTNRRAALAKRNCILELLPPDLIEDAIKEAEKTVEKGVTEDPELAKKNLIKAFASMGIPADQLVLYLGHPIGQCTAKEIVEMRSVYKSIRDQSSVWSDYFKDKGENAAKAAQSALNQASPPNQTPAVNSQPQPQPQHRPQTAPAQSPAPSQSAAGTIWAEVLAAFANLGISEQIPLYCTRFGKKNLQELDVVQLQDLLQSLKDEIQDNRLRQQEQEAADLGGDSEWR